MAYNEFTHAIDNADPVQPEVDATEIGGEQVETPEGVEPAESTEPSQSKDPNELIRALEADRDSANYRASQSEFVNKILRERYESAEQVRQTPSDIQEILNKMGAEDFVTASEVKRLQDYRESIVRDDYEQRIIDMQEEALQEKHDDYEDVLKCLVLPAVKADPSLFDTFRKSKNPAKAAYDYGCMQPAYQEYLRSKTAKSAEAQTSKVVDKISQNLSRPSTLGSTPLKGKTESDKVKDILSMSDDDFEKMIAEAKNQ